MNRLPSHPASCPCVSLFDPAATLVGSSSSAAAAAPARATRMACPSSISAGAAAGWEDEVERAWGAAAENETDSPTAARGAGLLAGLAIGGELLAALSPARIWRSQRWFSQVRRLWP